MGGWISSVFSNIVPQNLQYKRKRFKFAAVVMLIANVITGIVAIILAYIGLGVFTLVIQQVFSIFIIFLIFYIQEKLPWVLKIDFTPLRKIFSFSVYQFLFNFINYFSRNLDKLLIGRYIGAASLGQYDKSYRLMQMPLQNITSVVTPVIQPIFSDLHDNLYEMGAKYKKMFVFLCYIGFPLSILLFFSGDELILIIFGNQWHSAVCPFKILSLTVGLQILNGTTGAIYQSANATKHLFIAGCITAFLMITAFIIAIVGWATIKAVAIGFAIAQLLNSIQVYYMLFRILHYPIKQILSSMIYPLIISVLEGFVLLSFSLYTDNLSMVVSLVLKFIIFLIIWILCVNFAGPYKGLTRVYALQLKQKILARMSVS